MNPGFSKPWNVALQELTGSDGMDATSLMGYFDPLYKWLQEANSMSRECIGWEDYCESYASEYMYGEYENKTSNLYNKAAIAEWDFQTNLTDYNAEVSVCIEL